MYLLLRKIFDLMFYSRLENYDTPKSQIQPFLDDSSVSSEDEERDVEYDSDTFSSIDLYTTDEQEQTDTPPPAPNLPKTTASHMQYVTDSEFTGYGDDSASNGIDLKLGQLKSPHDVFQWSYLEEDVMDFDSFIESTVQALELTNAERGMVKDRLQAVQRQHENS